MYGQSRMYARLNLDFYKNHNEEIILTDLAKVLILYCIWEHVTHKDHYGEDKRRESKRQIN